MKKPPTMPVTMDSSAPSLTYWQRNSEWLKPTVLLLIGWLLINGKMELAGGDMLSPPAQVGLLFILVPQVLVGVVICLVGMKIADSTVGPFQQFLLQVAGVVVFGVALSMVVPAVGPWILQPLALSTLFAWLLEVSLAEGIAFGVATWLVSWGLMFFIVLRFFNNA